jgi:predicted nucleic acid-binding protein
VIVLDTTVLAYAVGGEHPLREPGRRLVAAIEAGQVRATTTTGVVQEFAHVRARRVGRADAAAVARHWAALLAPLLFSTTDDLDLGLELFERHESLGSFDAVLAATAVRAEAHALVSADRAFAGVAGLRHVDLASPELERQLGL